ncbi:MAG: hypothetical protein LBQ52_09835 [Helicobacteraceae bacterium]|jgi:hypothetical protein|nr:hypothetical protein [Helicobacteraceae bacterium]
MSKFTTLKHVSIGARFARKGEIVEINDKLAGKYLAAGFIERTEEPAKTDPVKGDANDGGGVKTEPFGETKTEGDTATAETDGDKKAVKKNK